MTTTISDVQNSAW